MPTIHSSNITRRLSPHSASTPVDHAPLITAPLEGVTLATPLTRFTFHSTTDELRDYQRLDLISIGVFGDVVL